MSDCQTYACCIKGCGHTIHLHHDLEQRLRRTHETFYCPAGHGQSFVGKTEDAKKIERLERQLETLRERWHEMYEDREEWKLEAKACPFECGFRVLRKYKPESIRLTLAVHLIEEHGARMPERVEEPVVA